MSRREDLWSQLSGINTTATNLFDNYEDPNSYEGMSAILDKINGDQSNAITRTAANTVQRGQRDTAARLASQGITGGSVFNNQINSVSDNINDNFAKTLENLDTERMKMEVPLMQTENDNKFRATSAQENIIMQNIMNALNKNQAGQSAVNSWEQSDANNRASSFNFFRDMLPGLIQGGANVASAGVLKSDIRAKKKIKYVGTSEEGLPIIEFNYKNSDPNRYRGTIAQAVQEVKPSAVLDLDGVLHVDYSQLSIRPEVVNGMGCI
ncbi:MAG: tail fiber domain-containing protein [Candidatus Aquicultor sp.]